MVVRMWLIIFAINFSYGAMLPDAIMDVVQSVSSNPDSWATNIGMTRVKRTTWDREYNFEKMNINLKIRFKDISNKLKGGLAEIEFLDFRNNLTDTFYVNSAKFVVDADTPGKLRDGLFDITVDYEINYLFKPIEWNGWNTTIVENGRLHCVRKMDNQLYHTSLKLESLMKNNAQKEPRAQIDLKSDHSSIFTGNFLLNEPNEQIKNGTFEIDLSDNNLIVAKGVFNDEKTYSFKFLAKKDFSMAFVDILLDSDRMDYFNTNFNTLPDKAPGQYKYEVNLIGKSVDEHEGIKFIVSYDSFKGLDIQYKSQKGLIVDLNCDMNENKVLKLQATVREHGEKTLEANTNISKNEDPFSTILNSKIDWTLKGPSNLHRLVYDLGYIPYLSSFKLESNLAINKKKPYLFDFYLTTLKDNGQILREIHATNMAESMYQLVLSENFLNLVSHIFNYNHTFTNDIVVRGDLNKRYNNFKAISNNRDWFDTFLIENIDGYMRTVTLDGLELMMVGFERNSNQVLMAFEMISGLSIDVKLSMKSISDYKAEIAYNGPNNSRAQFIILWNYIRDDIKLNIVSTGRNELLGIFNIEKYYSYTETPNNITLNVILEAEISNSHLGPNPIDSAFKIYFNKESGKCFFEIQDEMFSCGLA